MTIEELRKLATTALEYAKESLVQTKSFLPMAEIITAGEVHFIGIEPEGMNSGKFKGGLSHKLRQEIKRLNAEGIIFLSDIYVGEIIPGREEDAERAMKADRDLNVEDMTRLGYCRQRECIMIVAETPEYQQMGRQFYSRRKGGRPVLEEYREHNTEKDPDWYCEGRMAGFFRPVKEV